MNRFKVNVAKEKISRLREKYSKSVNWEEANKSSSESLLSSESLISLKIENRPEEENYYQQETKDNVEKQPSSSDITSTAKEDPIILKSHPETPIVIITQENKSDESDHSLKKPISSGSLVLSDLSNQFERLRFISSSSEDLSIVHSVDSQSDSISTKSVPSVTVPEKSTISQNINTLVKTDDYLDMEKNYFESIKITDEDASQKSLSVTGLNDSKMSSKRELNYVSETGDFYQVSSVLDSTQCSNTDISEIKSFDKADSTSKSTQNNYDEIILNSSPNISEKQSLIDITEGGLESRTESSREISNYSKRDKYKINHIDEGLERKEIDKQSSDKMSPRVFSLKNSKHVYGKVNNYVNKSTNTDPVKVKLLENKSKLNHIKSLAKIKRPCAEKIKKYKETKLGMKCDLSGKKTTKRQFIKPCSLIKYDDIGKLESNSEFKRNLESLDYNFTDNFHYNIRSIGVLQLNCDEVISELLKNQIKLTRHFIESHHHMYLQVCQAAQLLNENYSSNQ